jgi:hypothetical protein
LFCVPLSHRHWEICSSRLCTLFHPSAFIPS